MISTMKVNEYMGSTLSGIFRVKLVAKYILLWSVGTQLMHVKVN